MNPRMPAPDPAPECFALWLFHVKQQERPQAGATISGTVSLFPIRAFYAKIGT